MTKLISAVYEHGSFRPVQSLKLPEHQRVIIAVVIREEEVPGLFISKLAEHSKSFRFLSKPGEDIYSLSDGEEV